MRPYSFYSSQLKWFQGLVKSDKIVSGDLRSLQDLKKNPKSELALEVTQSICAQGLREDGIINAEVSDIKSPRDISSKFI